MADITHLPMDQLQDLEYCIDSNPPWGTLSFSPLSLCFSEYLSFVCEITNGVLWIFQVGWGWLSLPLSKHQSPFLLIWVLVFEAKGYWVREK